MYWYAEFIEMKRASDRNYAFVRRVTEMKRTSVNYSFAERLRLKLRLGFLSALFFRKESTIVMAFRQCFLRPPELTKIVLQNIIAPNCTIWPSELNQKGFSCYPA